MPTQTRRFGLRDLTSDAHKALDAAVGGFASLDGYKIYLRAITRFRAGAEATLGDIAWPEGWTWRPIAIGRELVLDGADLDVTVAQGDRVRIDVPEGRSELLGMLYVLEGAGLGARILQKRAAALGLGETFGARHLHSMSNDIAGWQAFLIDLENAEAFCLKRAAACANSVFFAAFHCFESETRAVQ